MGKVVTVEAPSVAPPGGDFSHAVVGEGKTVLVSGQVGLTAAGALAGPDVESQARQAFGNLEAVLAAVGCELGSLLKLTVFLTSRDDVAALARVRAEYLSAPFPASTVVVVAGLLDPDWKIEIEAMAVVPE